MQLAKNQCSCQLMMRLRPVDSDLVRALNPRRDNDRKANPIFNFGHQQVEVGRITVNIQVSAKQINVGFKEQIQQALLGGSASGKMFDLHKRHQCSILFIRLCARAN